MVQRVHKEFKDPKDLQSWVFKVFEVQRVHRAFKDFRASQVCREMMVM
jgi:hypothetical protein